MRHAIAGRLGGEHGVREAVASFLAELWKDESAEIAIEYGLLVGLVALVLVATFNLFGQEVGNFFTRIMARVANCPGTGGCS